MSTPGATIKVKTWTPTLKDCHGFMVTHNESLSISQYFSTPDHRMTSYYAYRPCKDSISSFNEFFSNNMQKHPKERILSDEIVSGVDELGVMLFGNKLGNYWFGSILDINKAKQIAPFNSATTLQVCAGVVAGMIWAIENPNEGVVESEEMDHKRVMEIVKPYLGKLVGVLTDWNPLKNRQKLFEEDLDLDSINQFKNFRTF
jgi:homospermidine synthase